MSTTIENIQIRQGTAADFATFVPRVGEPCYVTDTAAFFVGDGTSTGAQLTAAGSIGSALRAASLLNSRLAKTAAYTVVAADKGKVIDATTGTWTLSLTAAATLGDGFHFAVFNSGSGVITIDANASETIQDAASTATTKTLAQGEGGIVFCDGANFKFYKITVGAQTLASLGAIFNARETKTGAYTVVAGDKGKLFEATSGTWSLSLTAAATLGDGFSFAIFNSGSGTITIDPDAAETIRDATSSAATKTLTQGESAIIICNGSSFLMLKIAAGGGGSAATTTYDNSTSGLTATDVQDALDELAAMGGGGGGGSGSKTLIGWQPFDNNPPVSSYATLDSRNAIPVLAFATGESAVFAGIIRQGADLSSGIKVRSFWLAASATSGDFIVTSAFERGNTDLDADSFATGKDSAVSNPNGTNGIVTVVETTHSSAEIDGLAAGEFFRLKLTRKSAGDTVTGDLHFIGGIIEQVAAAAGGSSAPTTAVSTSTGNQDNFNFSDADVLFFNNASNVVLRGLVAGVDGQILDILAKGAGAVYLNNEDTNSTAANRILTRFPVTTNSLVIASGGSVTLIYDGTAARWVVKNFASGCPSGPLNYTELRRAADQTAGSASAAYASFDTEDSNLWGVFSSGNPTRVTIPTGQGGLWQFCIHWFMNQAVTGQIQLGARINGSTFVFAHDVQMNGATAQQAISFVKNLAAGDYIEFYYYQASGSDKTFRVQTFTACRLA